MKITVDLPDTDLDFIDNLLQAGDMASRSDVLVLAVRLLWQEVEGNGLTFVSDFASGDKM